MEIEQRFACLLALMKERYLASGYELDDVHLAQILGVHEGVLRKGKKNSVSPALSQAAGRVWRINLNWLLLGEGEPPEKSGPPLGLERLPLEKRIARGKWDEHKVRRLLAERGLSQKKLAGLLKTSVNSVGTLVRGQLRDPEMRLRLAGLLKLEPDSLFLTSAEAARSTAGLPEKTSARLYSIQELRSAMEAMIHEHLAPSLSEHSRTAKQAEFVSSLVSIEVPPAPDGLTESERSRYERNREVLERWSCTSRAFEVPSEVAGRYCREVVGFYEGGQVDDVGGVLRDFLQEASEKSDTVPEKKPDRLKLKKGVIAIGDTEIRVDDPELLAKLPEYLGSKAGRKSLLDWLRKNVKSK
ncbi:MAG: helix-turn-helix transcriptional regulator [Candidatus Glassbacteria bacterium]|nr:helix-turn-helix transcriptional regulator [Candidatus Glassbacteria bacterium]